MQFSVECSYDIKSGSTIYILILTCVIMLFNIERFSGCDNVRVNTRITILQ